MSGLIFLLCRLMAGLWSARSGDVWVDMTSLWSARSGDVGVDMTGLWSVRPDDVGVDMTDLWSVSQNLSIWVGDDTQAWIILHSHLLFIE